MSSSLSQNLIAARKNEIALDEFPGTLPDNPEDAYKVQSQCISGWSDELVGWKVAGLKADLHEQFKAKRQSGPVFKNNVQWTDCKDHILAPCYEKGFGAIEAEFVIVLGDVSNLPSENLTEQDAINAIDKVYMGIEIASSPMKDTRSYGTYSGICDFGNNAGVIIGPEIKNWKEFDFSNINVSVKIGGSEVGNAKTKPGLDGPLGAVSYLIEHLAKRGHEIKAGTIVSSGAITGVHDADIGVASEVTFEGVGTISLELVSNS